MKFNYKMNHLYLTTVECVTSQHEILTKNGAGKDSEDIHIKTIELSDEKSEAIEFDTGLHSEVLLNLIEKLGFTKNVVSFSDESNYNIPTPWTVSNEPEESAWRQNTMQEDNDQ